MTFIKNHKPNLNIQTDCIRAKLFNYYCSFLTVELFITHCYFGMYRLQLANFFFFDLIMTFIQLLKCLKEMFYRRFLYLYVFLNHFSWVYLTLQNLARFSNGGRHKQSFVTISLNKPNTTIPQDQKMFFGQLIPLRDFAPPITVFKSSCNICSLSFMVCVKCYGYRLIKTTLSKDNV